MLPEIIPKIHGILSLPSILALLAIQPVQAPMFPLWGSCSDRAVSEAAEKR